MDDMRFEGVTLLVDDVAGMAEFYENVLGFAVTERQSDYVAFDGGDKRLAIFRRTGRNEHTGDPLYLEARSGPTVELNFLCTSPEIVRAKYAELIDRGAVSVSEPVEREWGHVAGFFGDPEGNVHSIFAIVATE
jgi:catechol 2,3-dioxygenase-like lactoylglutathione lyase family enzyme